MQPALLDRDEKESCLSYYEVDVPPGSDESEHSDASTHRLEGSSGRSNKRKRVDTAHSDEKDGSSSCSSSDSEGPASRRQRWPRRPRPASAMVVRKTRPVSKPQSQDLDMPPRNPKADAFCFVCDMLNVAPTPQGSAIRQRLMDALSAFSHKKTAAVLKSVQHIYEEEYRKHDRTLYPEWTLWGILFHLCRHGATSMDRELREELKHLNGILDDIRPHTREADGSPNDKVIKSYAVLVRTKVSLANALQSRRHG